MAMEADNDGARILRLLPGGESPTEHDAYAGAIVAAALLVIVATRRGLAGGSAGHIHVSALDGIVTAAYVVIALAALKTLAARFAEQPWAQALAWVVA
jgi:hypothetical protein